MAEFPEVLTGLMKLEKLTQADFERASGIDRTTISRFQRGERIPDRAQLGRLVASISADRARRLELLLAHLRDEAAAAHPAGIDERHYIIAPAEDNPAEKINVPGTLAADLQLIADECASNEIVRDVITDLSRMIMRHRAELADKVVYQNFKDKADPMVAEDAPAATNFQSTMQREIDRAERLENDQSGTPAATPKKSEPAAHR